MGIFNKKFSLFIRNPAMPAFHRLLRTAMS